MTDKKMTRAQMAAKADELLADAFVTTQAVMTDKEAPATSRASAVSSALAIHRLLVGDGSPEKDPSDMSTDEIAEQLARLRGQQNGVRPFDD